MIRELSYPLSNFNSLILDPLYAGNKVIKLIFEKNKQNHVQFFYQNHNKTADIYIIDELGGLYHQKVNIEKNSIHINHFMLFLDSIIKRICLNDALCDLFQDSSDDLSSPLEDLDASNLQFELENENSSSEMQLEVFEIHVKTAQKFILRDQYSKLQGMPTHFFRIQVIVDSNDNGKRLYIIYANEK